MRVEDFMIDKICLNENFSCLYVYKYIYIYKSIQVLSVILFSCSSGLILPVIVHM